VLCGAAVLAAGAALWVVRNSASASPPRWQG
jgi:hypothetical protein